MDLNVFKKLPIMGILRGIKSESITPLVEAIVSSGLKTIEITMNTDGAPALITQMVQATKNRLMIGAGTVLTLDDLNLALDAGATFIVSPVCRKDIIQTCVTKSIPVFPGAFTPNEIYTAWESGASMVKLFPAHVFGPDYINVIKAPLQNIELLACGGVTVQTIKKYFLKGASAVAFGASIFNKEKILQGQFASIEDSIKQLIRAYTQQ
ncbi:MAG: bifunctional 4-hydroxy-2-oxoglutarate aldolase/2-dehydro-3-deoxy-phosphogluconate aldolase [bacterium]